jgi:hypothetical protein
MSCDDTRRRSQVIRQLSCAQAVAAGKEEIGSGFESRPRAPLIFFGLCEERRRSVGQYREKGGHHCRLAESSLKLRFNIWPRAFSSSVVGAVIGEGFLFIAMFRQRWYAR